MRWFGFGILAFVGLVLQVGVAGPLGLGPGRIVPDLLLMAAIVLAYRGNDEKALVGCWILGVIKDMSSGAPLGSYALAFGLVALGVMWVRDLFYGEHPLILIGITFVCSLMVENLVLLIGSAKGVFEIGSWVTLWPSIMFSALFTAGLAPYGQWLMMKFHRQLGLSRRRKYKQI